MTDHPKDLQYDLNQQNGPNNYQAYIIHAYEHRAYPLLDEESFWIGRSSDSDIVIREVFVSRKHAEIRPDVGGFSIYPVGSTQTTLNGIQITSHQPLSEGDVIRIGSMKFTFAKERLPVAMQIADPWVKANKLYDEVSDRRPTLSFPVQTMPVKEQKSSGTSWWIWLLILLGIVAVVSGLMMFASL